MKKQLYKLVNRLDLPILWISAKIAILGEIRYLFQKLSLHFLQAGRTTNERQGQQCWSKSPKNGSVSTENVKNWRKEKKVCMCRICRSAKGKLKVWAGVKRRKLRGCKCSVVIEVLELFWGHGKRAGNSWRLCLFGLGTDTKTTVFP